MPIFIDYSNVSVIKATGYGSDFKKGSSIPNMNKIFRHVMLSDFLKIKKEWSSKCGDIVVACDSKTYWRKSVFPYYKGLRKKNREESDMDWNSIFGIMSDFKAELRECFPYKVLEVDGAEADDVIGVLTKYLHTNEHIEIGLESEAQKVLAVSSDGDFLQLYKYGNYAQWDPIKKHLKSRPESTFLVDKIIRGDQGDGIPSTISEDDFLMEREKYGRAQPVTKKIIEKFSDLSNLSTAELEKYKRNEQLISFDKIPLDIVKPIIMQYRSQKPVKNPGMILDYVNKNQLKLIDKVTQF